MIQIQVNGEYLELFPDIRINMQLRNPIFADGDIIPGSFSLPFDLPGGDLSGNNARILNNPDLVESRTGKLKFTNVTIYFDGVPFKSGELIINPVSGKSYRGNFNFGLRTIASDFKSSKIRDIIDEVISMTVETYSKKIYAAPSGGTSSPYKIHINGKDFEGATLQDLATDINNEIWDPDITATYVSTGTTPLGYSAPFITIVPANPTDPDTEFHVDSENNEYSTRANWYIEAEPVTTYVNSIKTFVESYISSTPADDKLRFPMVYNDGFYEEYKTAPILMPKSQRFWANYAPDGTLRTNDPNYGATNTKPFMIYNYTNVQPFIPLKYIFDQIANSFGFTYEGDFFDDPYYLEALFSSSFVIDKEMPYIGPLPYLFWLPSFNLRELVPDITVEELFKGIQKKLNLAISYNEDLNAIRIIKRGPIFQDTSYIDLSEISGPVDDIDVVAVDGVRLESKIDESDLLAVDDYFESGSPELIISSIFSGLEGDYTAGAYQFLKLRQKALEDFTPRLVFYKGIDGTNGYPKASYLGWEMKFSGISGLGETAWKEYIRFLKSRKQISLKMDMPFRTLKAIDWEKKYRIHDSVFFFKSIDINLTMKGISISKVDLFST